MHILELLEATGRHLAACLVWEAESIAVIRILNSFWHSWNFVWQSGSSLLVLNSTQHRVCPEPLPYRRSSGTAHIQQITTQYRKLLQGTVTHNTTLCRQEWNFKEQNIDPQLRKTEHFWSINKCMCLQLYYTVTLELLQLLWAFWGCGLYWFWWMVKWWLQKFAISITILSLKQWSSWYTHNCTLFNSETSLMWMPCLTRK